MTAFLALPPTAAMTYWGLMASAIPRKYSQVNLPNGFLTLSALADPASAESAAKKSAEPASKTTSAMPMVICQVCLNYSYSRLVLEYGVT